MLLSSHHLSCRAVSPLIEDKARFSNGGFDLVPGGNLSLPSTKLPLATDVLSFVSLQALAGYSESLEPPLLLNERGLQVKLHVMMQGLAQCCLADKQHDAFYALDAPGHLAGRVTLAGRDVSLPSSSAKASKKEAGIRAFLAAAGARKAAERETAAAAAAATAGASRGASTGFGKAGSHPMLSEHLRGHTLHAKPLPEAEAQSKGHPSSGKADFVVCLFCSSW